MNDLMDERMRKAQDIISLYESREYRQEDIARKLGIPTEVVRKVTKTAGYEHGKKVTVENRNENQSVRAFSVFGNLDILDKYNFKRG